MILYTRLESRFFGGEYDTLVDGPLSSLTIVSIPIEIAQRRG